MANPKYKYSWQTGYTGEDKSSSASGGDGDILSQYQQQYDEAKQANEARYSQALGIADQAIKRYKPGGGFGEGAMAQYQQGKHQAMSQGMSSLVSSGLSNTTVAAGMPLAYEQEVGTPFRLQLEDMRMNKLTEAERAKADIIQNRQDTYPDLSMMAQLQERASVDDTYGGGGSSLNLSSLSEFGSSRDMAGVSARNAAGKIEQGINADKRDAENQAAKQRLSAAREATAAKDKENRNQTSGTSMSDADFKALLDYNMGNNSVPSRDSIDTNQTSTQTAPKKTSTSSSSSGGWMDYKPAQGGTLKYLGY